MLKFSVDETLCTRCGECVQDCPSRIIAMADGQLPGIRPEQEPLCIQCQHCLAVCPTAAVSIFGRKPEDSLPLPAGALPTLDALTLLVRGRRSVRRYLPENVDPALIRRLLATLANVPTGVNRHALTFTLIADREVMQRFRVKAMDALAAAARAGRVKPAFAYLQNAVPAWVNHRVDIIFRGAPHLLIASEPFTAPCPTEDIPLALATFDLLAQSAGLGAVWCGMLKMLLEAVPELKADLGLPADHAYYAMLFGRPAVHYPRTVQRDTNAVIRTVG